MAKSDAERARAYRDRKRSGPPREPSPCGTRNAYIRHKNRLEDPCAACVEAARIYNREAARRRYARLKAAKER